MKHHILLTIFYTALIVWVISLSNQSKPAEPIESPPITQEEYNHLMKAAYQVGYTDASYELDDVGLVHLTINDIQEQLR